MYLRLIMILMFGSGAGLDEGSKATGCASDLRQQSRGRKWAVPRAKDIQHLVEDMSLAMTATRKLPHVGSTYRRL